MINVIKFTSYFLHDAQIHEVGGYCPQFNGLIEELTGYETLHFFCKLRGMSYKESSTLPFYLASRLAFMAHLDVQAKNYR